MALRLRLCFRFLIISSIFSVILVFLQLHLEEYDLNYEESAIDLLNRPDATKKYDSKDKDIAELLKQIPKYDSKDKDVAELLKQIPDIKAPRTDCQKVFNNDTKEIRKVIKKERKHHTSLTSKSQYTAWTANCTNFKLLRNYILEPLTQEEEDFPIAYSVLIFKDLSQFERLLRAIYMPQNYYCIHVDAKSPDTFKSGARNIANCFPNVFISSKSFRVKWGTMTVLEPELTCMEDLLNYNKWKYFINLTGQEFPLQTNGDLVDILKVFNGSAVMYATIARRNPVRTSWVHDGIKKIKPRKRKDPPPHGIRLAKGAVHIVISRDTVQFMIRDPIAKDFLTWVRDTAVPDETFFASLVHSPHLQIPGAYKGDPDAMLNSLSRFKNWNKEFPCSGKSFRNICIISLGDLPFLKDRPELFINKLHAGYSPSAFDCLEEFHFKHMRDRLLGKRKIDLDFYRQFDYTWNHV